MAEYDRDWLKSYYDEYGEREWERWNASPVEQVKFEVHLYYLRRHLTADDRILEIGAGPGRFTQELARISNRIVVADLSPVQLELNRQNAQRLGYGKSVERWVECDVCDLRPCFEDAKFDAVVCYGGPLSYVFGEREKAMAELLRVTKPGGLLFLGVMSLWGTVHPFLPQVLALDPAMNQEIVATGDLGPDKPEATTHFCHLYRAAEFRGVLERAGVAIEALSASNYLTAIWGEVLAEAQKDSATWQHLMEMELEACREPGCLDMGTHLIAVCRKSSAGSTPVRSSPRQASLPGST
jgi:ubiquinone/menaquinone biosynthesis C-methylase UbiE